MPARTCERVVESVGEALREDVIEVGVDVGLEGEHVGGGESGAMAEETPDALVAVGRGPVQGEGVAVVVGCGAGVGGGDDAAGGVEDLWELVEGDVAGPLARGVGTKGTGLMGPLSCGTVGAGGARMSVW